MSKSPAQEGEGGGNNIESACCLRSYNSTTNFLRHNDTCMHGAKLAHIINRCTENNRGNPHRFGPCRIPGPPLGRGAPWPRKYCCRRAVGSPTCAQVPLRCLLEFVVSAVVLVDPRFSLPP